MEDKLVSYKTAKLAKEKGFNWKVFSYYKSEMSLFNIFPDYEQDIDNWNNITFYINCYSAPTQSLLQKWLREKHSIHINIGTIAFNRGINKMPNYGYCISSTKNHNKKITNYEEALEEGLYEALKFIE